VAVSEERWERFIHDQRNSLFALQVKTERARRIAHESRARAAETRLRARDLHPLIAANLRRCALVHARPIARDQGLLSVVAEEIRDRLLGKTAAG
jgi:hypothetical protein